MNKKAQYQMPQEQPSPFGNVHPVLILGIVLFILPYFNYVLKWGIPGWVSGVGILFILVGALLTIAKSVGD